MATNNYYSDAIKTVYRALKEKWAAKLLFYIAATQPGAIVRAAEEINREGGL